RAEPGGGRAQGAAAGPRPRGKAARDRRPGEGGEGPAGPARQGVVTRPAGAAVGAARPCGSTLPPASAAVTAPPGVLPWGAFARLSPPWAAPPARPSPALPPASPRPAGASPARPAPLAVPRTPASPPPARATAGPGWAPCAAGPAPRPA